MIENFVVVNVEEKKKKKKKTAEKFELLMWESDTKTNTGYFSLFSKKKPTTLFIDLSHEYLWQFLLYIWIIF
jgi:hypothetical protein